MACKRDIKVLLIDKVAELSKTNSISKVNTMFGTEVIKPSGRIFIPSSLIDIYWNKYNEVKNKPVTPERREISLTPNIKPGVAELFEENPDFSSQIYEALGFTPSMKETLAPKNINETFLDSSKGLIDYLKSNFKGFDFLFPFIEKYNIKLDIQNNFSVNHNFASGGYNWITNTIVFDKDLFFQSDSFERTLLHEIIHGILRNKYIEQSGKKTLNQQEFKVDIDDYIKSILPQLKEASKNNKRLNDIYEIIQESSEEVITYGLTDKEFINFLKNTPSNLTTTIREVQKTNTLWDIFYDIISKIFGKSNLTRNKLEELTDLLNDVLEVNYTIDGFTFNNIEYQQITPQQKQQAQQLYSQYLDTIFPDSKVKDIVYHGSFAKEIDKFDKSKFLSGEGMMAFGKGFYFTEGLNTGRYYSDSMYASIYDTSKMDEADILAFSSMTDEERNNTFKGKLYFVKLNIKNPLIWENVSKEKQSELKKGNYGTNDSVIHNAQGFKQLYNSEKFEELSFEKLVLEDALKRNSFDYPEENSEDKYFTEEQRKNVENELEEIIKKLNTFNNQINGETHYIVPEPEQIHILSSKADIEGFKQFVSSRLGQQGNIFYQNLSENNLQDYVASEKTIRDLAARMSDRIGIPVRFEFDTTKEYKGKLENNTAIINLAYATLDTPIHEILGHPIIRAIKNKNFNNIVSNKSNFIDWVQTKQDYKPAPFMEGIMSEEIYKEAYKKYGKEWEALGKNNTQQLYQNLLKELEYGKGKEVLDRIKRDYDVKTISKNYSIIDKSKNTDLEIIQNFGTYWFKEYNEVFSRGKQFDTNEELQSLIEREQNKIQKYTLEEQQEEAIVELLGLYTADRLDKVKDGKLISLLKRLLKEIKSFVRSLLTQREVEIDKLPDSMTLGDIADLLAYSNSKLILPGNEVIYTTPDNQKFKTYAEASNHISKLIKSVEDVDLGKVELKKESFWVEWSETRIRYDNPEDPYDTSYYNKDFKTKEEADSFIKNLEIIGVDDAKVTFKIHESFSNKVFQFIERNKQYEQSKEIIEEWKKVNNIQYNPEEVYSRGQGFYSISGAFADFDVELMFQNLLAHIEDNEKSGGKYIISATTDIPEHSKSTNKLITKNYGKNIYYKIFPKSEDILWATPIDCMSGSVLDAAEKVGSKLGKELTGVSYTKYPSLENVSEVQPSLAETLDKTGTNRRFYNYNELGISLTGNNFRLEYDEDIPYSTKKIINSINSILDQKYGKLVKPEIKKENIREEITYKVQLLDDDGYLKADVKSGFKTLEEAKQWAEENKDNYIKWSGSFNYEKVITKKTGIQEYQIVKYGLFSKEANDILDEFDTEKEAQTAADTNNKRLLDNGESEDYSVIPIKKTGIQPTQTNENLKESIESVKNKTLGIFDNSKYVHPELGFMDGYNNFESDEFKLDTDTFKLLYNVDKKTYNVVRKFPNYWQAVSKSNLEYYSNIKGVQVSKIIEEQKKLLNEKIEKYNKKEYTSQALINTKVAALKQVAKKYPRSLIRSEVDKITITWSEEDILDLPFQKISTKIDLANIPANKDMEMKMLPDDIKGEYDIFLDELNDSDVNPIFKGTQGETLVDENNNLCALK